MGPDQEKLDLVMQVRRIAPIHWTWTPEEITTTSSGGTPIRITRHAGDKQIPYYLVLYVNGRHVIEGNPVAHIGWQHVQASKILDEIWDQVTTIHERQLRYTQRQAAKRQASDRQRKAGDRLVQERQKRKAQIQASQTNQPMSSSLGRYLPLLLLLIVFLGSIIYIRINKPTEAPNLLAVQTSYYAAESKLLHYIQQFIDPAKQLSTQSSKYKTENDLLGLYFDGDQWRGAVLKRPYPSRNEINRALDKDEIAVLEGTHPFLSQRQYEIAASIKASYDHNGLLERLIIKYSPDQNGPYDHPRGIEQIGRMRKYWQLHL